MPYRLLMVKALILIYVEQMMNVLNNSSSHISSHIFQQNVMITVMNVQRKESATQTGAMMDTDWIQTCVNVSTQSNSIPNYVIGNDLCRYF